MQLPARTASSSSIRTGSTRLERRHLLRPSVSTTSTTSASDLVDVIDVMVGTDVAPTCSFTRPVSLLHVHGLSDQLVPFNGGASPVDASGFPPVKGGLAGYAAYDGCSGWTTSLYNGRSDDTEYDAQNCPAWT